MSRKAIDLTGRRFGRLVVEGRDERHEPKKIFWTCRCDCGNRVAVSSSALLSGHTKSCGCLRSETSRKIGQRNAIDLTGQRFGRLVVLRPSNLKTMGENHYKQWVCQCDCGERCVVNSHSLRAGLTRSCGCLRRETSSKIGKQRAPDLTGQKFGKLTVIERAGTDNNKKALWRCKCECGGETVVRAQELLGGHTRSCGCLQHHHQKGSHHGQ